jgi:hypothetical protein
MAEKARVYGMADQDNRDLPSAQGLRGEKSSLKARDHEPELTHSVTLGTGRTVSVSEGSGVAYAEATGRIAAAPDHAEPPAPPSTRSRLPVMLAAASAGIAAGIYLIRRLSARPDEVRPKSYEPTRETDGFVSEGK